MWRPGPSSLNPSSRTGEPIRDISLRESGYDTPAEAHLLESSKKDLPKEAESNKIKVGLAVRERKEVGEKTILGDGFMKTGSEKEKVLICQIVTTSYEPGHLNSKEVKMVKKVVISILIVVLLVFTAFEQLISLGDWRISQGTSGSAIQVTAVDAASVGQLTMQMDNIRETEALSTNPNPQEIDAQLLVEAGRALKTFRIHQHLSLGLQRRGLVLCFAGLSVGQPTMQMDNIRETEALSTNPNPQEIDAQLLVEAGKALNTFRNRYYLGWGIQAGGVVLWFVGIIAESPALALIGSLAWTGGAVVRLIAFNSIGVAGERLIRAGREY